jgi:Mn-containing catalase
MIQRFDQLAADLPEPDGPNPAAAAAAQELMGGKFGEMTGADVGRLLPIPSVGNKQFPEAAKLEAEGLHTIMWRWSQSDLYEQIGEIWNGPHPEDREELEVRDEMPAGFPWPEFPEEPQLCAPGDIDPELMSHYAKKLD